MSVFFESCQALWGQAQWQNSVGNQAAEAEEEAEAEAEAAGGGGGTLRVSAPRVR